MGIRRLSRKAVRVRHGGPAPRRIAHPDAGMVTVEAAFACVSLSMVVMLLIPVFVVLAAQLRVDDAARVAARSAARGNDDEATSLANQSAPRATVDIERGDGRVHVSVRESVSLPIPGLGAIDIHANSLVRDEVSLSEGFDE